MPVSIQVTWAQLEVPEPDPLGCPPAAYARQAHLQALGAVTACDCGCGSETNCAGGSCAPPSTVDIISRDCNSDTNQATIELGCGLEFTVDCPPQSPPRTPQYGSAGGALIDRAAAIGQVPAATSLIPVEGPQGCDTMGARVNAASGNLMFELRTTPGGVYEPPVRLSYHGIDDAASDFGNGWTSLYSQSVNEVDANTVDVTKGTGTVVRYQKDASGNYVPGMGSANKLVKNGGGDWTETQPDGFSLNYDSSGKLEKLENKAGNIWTLSYDGATTRVESIEDPFSRLTTFAYDGSNKIESIADPHGRVTTFTVDGSGNLTKMTTPELCVTEMTYDVDDQLTGWINPSGERTTYSFDGDRRLTEVLVPTGDRTTYTYADSFNTKIEDADGETTTLVFTGDRNLSAMVNALGERTTYVWDENTKLTEVLEPRGDCNTYTYHTTDFGAKYLESIQKPDGGIFTYSYDNDDQIDKLTDERGNVTTLVWDSGKRTAVVDPLGNRTTYVYNSREQIEAMVDPLGNRTTTIFDSAGQVSALENPLGERTTYHLPKRPTSHDRRPARPRHDLYPRSSESLALDRKPARPAHKLYLRHRRSDAIPGKSTR